MAIPPAIRFSKTSTPPLTDLRVDDRIVIAQPVTGPETTGYRTVRVTPSELTTYFKSVLQNDGIDEFLSLGGGLIGTGTVDDPLRVDETWTDSYAIRYDKFALSTVGDATVPELPISGSYFSVNYPYNSEEQSSTSYIESNGTLSILSPVTNGIQIRYTYSRINNYLTGNRVVSQSDSVYKVPGLAADEYVSCVFTTTQTAMVVEITNTTTNTKTHGFVVLNGTLSYQQHTLIRLEQRLLAEFAGSSIRSFQDRTPLAFIYNGKYYIAGASHGPVQSGIQLHFFEVDPVTGVLTRVTGWQCDSRFLSQATGDFVQLTNGFHTTTSDPGYELYSDRDFTSNATSAGGFDGNSKSIHLYVAQDAAGNLRFGMLRTSSISYVDPTEGSIVLFFSFTTCFNMQLGAQNKLLETPHTRSMQHTIQPRVVGTVWGGGYRGETIPSFNAGQTPTSTLLSDGSFWRCATSVASNTNTTHWVLPCKAGNTAYGILESVDKSIYVDQKFAPTQWVRIATTLPAITPVVARTNAHYMATSGAAHTAADRGTIFLTDGPFRSESKGRVRAKVKGNIDPAKPFKLLDVGDRLGYPLNNDRIVIDASSPIPNLPGISYRKLDGSIHHGIGHFTETTDNYVNPLYWHCDTDLNPIKRIRLPSTTQTALVNAIEARYSANSDRWYWRIAMLPNDPLNRCLLVVAHANSVSGGSSVHYGFANTTVSLVSDNLYDLTSVDVANAAMSTTTLHGSATTYRYSHGHTAAAYAVQETTSGVFDFICKEGLTALNAAGQSGGISGSYQLKYTLADGIVAFIQSRSSPDGTSGAIYPCIGPGNLGLGTLDTTTGYGTYYLYRPIFTDGLTEDEAKGYVLLSPTPSQTFTVNIGGDIPVQLDGIRGVITGRSIDLATLGLGAPANKTFLFYAITTVDGIDLKITTKALIERLDQTLIAIVTTGAEVVESIVAAPFSRFGTYRLSEYPRGTAAPGTPGQAHTTPPNYWLKNQY